MTTRRASIFAITLAVCMFAIPGCSNEKESQAQNKPQASPPVRDLEKVAAGRANDSLSQPTTLVSN